MAARDSVRFDIIGRDLASDAFLRAGRSVSDMGNKMDMAATKAAFLDDALKRQRETARRTSDAALSLAKSDDILAEVEHRLAAGALEAEFALKKEADAKKKSGEAARKAAEENKGFAASLQKIADSAKKGGGPAWLGPALLAAPLATSLLGVGAGAAVGLGGAAVAGGGALAAFGAIAKPVLADALAAEQKINTIQNNLAATLQTGPNAGAARAAQQAANTKALLSYNAALAGGANPAKALAAYQLTLAKNQATYNAAVNQGTFAAKAQYAATLATNKAYADLSPQQIALSKQLGNMAQAWQNLKAAETPVVAGALQPWLKSVTDLTGKLAPIIAAVSPVIMGLGTQFDHLVNSRAFTAFRDFVANTGSKVVGAVGGTLIDFVKAFMVLLVDFNPLILQMTKGIADLGPAVLRWASSKKTADEITKFMGWFKTNGPAVGGLFKNIGLALKALAPGLGPAATIEINVISGFFALIAKLPPAIAKPLVEVAAVMLTLNKLGVVSVGVKLLGLGGAGAAGAAGEAAAGGAAAGMWSKLLPGVRLAGGALAVTLIVDTVLKNTSSGPGGKNWFDNPFGMPGPKDPKSANNWLTSFSPYERFITKTIPSWYNTSSHAISHIWDLTWHNTVDRLNNGVNDVDRLLGGWEHNAAHWFDTARRDTAHIWDLTWSNTVGRLNRGMNDTDRLLGGWEHNVAHWFDTGRHDIAAIWDLTWRNTVDRVGRGVGDVVRWISTLPGKAVSALSKLGGDMLNIGTQAMSQLWAGLKSAAGSAGGGGIIGWLGGFAHGVVNTFKKIWGWFSPSTVMYQGGKSLMQGLANGIKDHAHLAMGQASATAHQVANAGSGVMRWEPLVMQALKMEGLGSYLASQVLYQMMTESGGNPNAINLTDSNAAAGDPSRGLLQTIMTTFQAYHWPGTSNNIYDPLANIAAAINYARHVYGPTLMSNGMGMGSGHGYAAGTMSAAPGWAWVGEAGPELMHFRGGEQVYPAQAAAAAGGGTQTIIIQVDPAVAAVTPDRTLGRHIAEHVTQFVKGGGRLYPQGITPR